MKKVMVGYWVMTPSGYQMGPPEKVSVDSLPPVLEGRQIICYAEFVDGVMGVSIYPRVEAVIPFDESQLSYEDSLTRFLLMVQLEALGVTKSVMVKDPDGVEQPIPLAGMPGVGTEVWFSNGEKYVEAGAETEVVATEEKIDA